MSKLTSRRSPEALRAEILAALSEPIERIPVSPLYRVGLAVTAVAMLILPLLYLGLIALIGHTIWWVWIPAPIAQWDPWVRFVTLIVGVILLLFLIKPWFAGDPQTATP